MSTLHSLVNGERMNQAEFHRRYLAYPPDEKWELIGGVVYKAPPVPWIHGTYASVLGYVFGFYLGGTPGVESAHNVTILLGKVCEPQPDLVMRLVPEYGGSSFVNEDDFVKGPPEVVAEIAHSSRAIELHEKRDDYLKAGVTEYLVVCVEEQEIIWTDFQTGRPIKPSREGIWQSRVFPGLWVDGPALLAQDLNRLCEAIEQGLASPGHARFVKRLQVAFRKHSSR